MVVWRQPKGLRNSVKGKGNGKLRAGEWKFKAEGTQEKVRTPRRDKAPLLGKTRRGRVGCHRKLLEPEPVCGPVSLQKVEHAWCSPPPPHDQKPLASPPTSPAAGSPLLAHGRPDLQVAGANHYSYP